MSASDIRSWQLPLQWPPAAERAARAGAPRAAPLLKAGILLCLASLTLFDRFGLRLSDAYSIPAALVAMYALVGLAGLGGALELNARAALAYLAVATVAGLSFLANATFGRFQYVSMGSFLLLLVVYAPFVVTLRQGTAEPALWRWLAGWSVAFALLLGVAGIAQFFAQFFFSPPWLFDYTPLIPAALRGSGVYNTVNAAGDWIKSNGFFLREASGFSFFMAFALLCELALSRRRWVMAILATALVLTYSGSGLLTLAVALLFPLGRRSVAQLLSAAVLAGLVVAVLGDALHLSYTLGRVEEFQSPRSSAYCRFVQPALVAAGEIDASPWASLLGHGPGTMQKMHHTCETTFGKLTFEYGFLGILAFSALILGALARAAVPVRIAVALGLSWLVLGGNLLNPAAALFIYLFSAMWPEAIAARAVPREAGA
jgi:hypothetical protein